MLSLYDGFCVALFALQFLKTKFSASFRVLSEGNYALFYLYKTLSSVINQKGNIQKSCFLCNIYRMSSRGSLHSLFVLSVLSVQYVAEASLIIEITCKTFLKRRLQLEPLFLTQNSSVQLWSWLCLHTASDALFQSRLSATVTRLLESQTRPFQQYDGHWSLIMAKPWRAKQFFQVFEGICHFY